MNQRDPALTEVATQLRGAAAARKCWACGCLHQSLDAVERTIPTVEQSADLQEAVVAARQRLVPVRYDCLGCEECYPAVALSALRNESQAAICRTEAVEERPGWPPLPGSYTVVKYQAAVAVCTLTDGRLMAALATGRPTEVAIIGTMQTENLGIERLITNVLANPSIRFVVVCGVDSRQAIGHLPGQSLLALAHSGIGESSRIIGARGKRPFLRNVSAGAIEHFRRTVKVIDRVGVTDVDTILKTTRECAERHPGRADAFFCGAAVTPVAGYSPDRMIPDPAGYFVVYLDSRRQLLSVEHYRNDGLLTAVVEGRTAAEVSTPIIDRKLISRLDHATYLGRELARAERALLTGEPYVQDGAPEGAGAARVRAGAT